MIKIGVVSDTHIPSRSYEIPYEIIHALDDADYIIHAGDVTEMNVIAKLQGIAPVYAVQGNMDSTDIKNNFPIKRILDFHGVKIGVVHGSGAPFGIHKRVMKLFEKDNVDCIVFGHTHQAEKTYKNNILLFNPGSPTDKYFSKIRSFGLLFIDDDKKINAEIITV